MARSSVAQAGPSNINRTASSSQPKPATKTTSKSPLFVDEHGEPIHFFLQWDLEEELQIKLRQLISKRNGKVIAATPLPQRGGIILVDPNTELGSKFCRGANEKWKIVTYTYLKACIYKGRLLNPLNFGQPKPIFNERDGQENATYFHIHETVGEEKVEKLSLTILKHGGVLTQDEGIADFIVVDKNHSEYRNLKQKYQFTSAHLVTESWLDASIQAGEFDFPKAKQRNVGGRKPGSVRNEFTDDEDRHIVRLIAKYYPDPNSRGRAGSSMWTYVCSKPDEYSWFQTHPPLSWQNRYYRNREIFDRKVAKYLRAHPEFDVDDDTAAHKRPWINSPSKDSKKRKRDNGKGDRDSEEEGKISKRNKTGTAPYDSDDAASEKAPPPSSSKGKAKVSNKSRKQAKGSSRVRASQKDSEVIAMPDEDEPEVQVSKPRPKPRRKGAIQTAKESQPHQTNSRVDEERNITDEPLPEQDLQDQPMEPVFDDVIQNHMDDNNPLGEAEPEPMATEPSAETNQQDKLEDEAEVSADLEMEQSADVERDESRDSVGPLLAEEPPRMDMDEIEEQEVLFETSPEKHRIELDEEESQDTESFPPIRIAPHPEPGVEDDTLDVYARAVGRKEGPKNDKYSRMLRKNQPSATNDPFSEIQDDTSGPSSGFSSKTARPPTQDDAVLPTPAANRGPRKRNVTSAKSKTRANKSLNPNGSASAPSWTTIPVDPEPDFLIPGDLNVRLSGRTSGGTATTTTKTLVSLNASTLVDRDSMAKGKDDTGKAGHTIEDEADIPFPDEEPRIPTPPPPSPPIRRLRRGRSASVEVTASQATKRGKEREGSVSSVANKGETGRGKGRAKVKPSKELSAVPGIPEEPAVIEDNQVPTINPSALEPTRATGKPAKSRSMKPKKPVSSQEDKTAPAPSYPAATVKDMNELMSISTSTGLPLEEVVALFGECEGNLMITRRMANRMAGR